MILFIGDLMLDVLVLPSVREAEQPAGIVVRPGGSAANSAAWAAHAGADTTFVGCVGTDVVGEILVRDLQDRGVVPRVRTVAAHESGCVAVEVTAAGERLMRSSRGANQALSPGDILAARSACPSWVHLTGYALLGPYGFDILGAAGELARACQARVSFDPSSPTVIRRLGPDRFLDEISRAGVSLLLPNAEEAQALGAGASAPQAARRLARIVSAVVVKDGRRGATYSDRTEAGEVPTSGATPVDTTGAGDAFNGILLARVAAGKGLRDACVAANAGAREAILDFGGRPRRGPSATVT